MRKETTNLLLLLTLTGGCSLSAGDEDTPRGGNPENEVLAYVGDEAITREEVDRVVAGELRNLRQQEYDLRRRGLDQIMTRKLLEMEAERRGMTLQELTARAQQQVQAPTEEEVQQFYDANLARMGGRSLDQVRPSINGLLRRQAMDSVRVKLLDEIKKTVDVRVLLEPLRTEVPIPEGEPTRGAPDAPVTLVEFSDFQCPYCKRAHPALEKVLAEYGDRIRFVYRDYPLPNHPQAIPASEAARCANEQNKYWEYYDNLMTVAGALNDEDLRKRAEEVKLDVEAFTACVESDRWLNAIQAGLRDGQAVGVTGTPTFFINGRMLSGVTTAEKFKEVIDEELARASAAGSGG